MNHLPPHLRSALLRPSVLLGVGSMMLFAGIMLTALFFQRMDALDAISGGFVGFGLILVIEGIRRWRRSQQKS